MASPHDVTALLGEWSRGNRTALNQLLPLVYAELRRLASQHLAEEKPGLRRNPPLTEGVEQLGTGGLSQSGGAAGGARGHGGHSDDGAGGPMGDSRSGPGQHKSTSRGDLDR